MKSKSETGLRKTKVKFTNFFSAPPRCKKACMNCRRRKKKCDGNVPVCGTCKVKKYISCWQEAQNPSHSMPILVHSDDYENSDFVRSFVRKYNEFYNWPQTLKAVNCDPEDADPLNNDSVRLSNANLNLEKHQVEISSENNSNNFQGKERIGENDYCNTTPCEEWINELIIPQSLYLGMDFSLDSQGLHFLEFFKIKVSTFITVGPLSSNYLLKTFIPLAVSSKPIQYALASWGGMFIDGKPNIHNYQVYMVKASKLLLMDYDMSTTFSKKDFFVILSFFLIAMSIEICSGDVSQWKTFLEQCKDLIIRQGGIIKILHDFHFSNDIKWMISNLQFHDILSSGTYLNGSILMDEYKTVFGTGKLLETDNYGIDPYQGCNQPIYLLLGDIVTQNIIIKQKQKQLQADLHKLHDDKSQNPFSLNAHRNSFSSKLRITYYEYINHTVKNLREEVEKCQPHELQISQDLSQLELEAHLSLFKLIKYSCELLLLQIEMVPPSSYKLQAILMHALDHIDSIIDTRMIPCLGFPLLMCGMVAYKEEDQEVMKRQIEKLMQTYFVGNMEKIYYIIKEAWKMNTDGNLCFDWAEIANEKGWLLFSC